MSVRLHEFAVDERDVRRRFPFAALWRRIGGIVDEVSVLPQERGVPWFEMAVAMLGNLTMTFPHVSTEYGNDTRLEALGGAGADSDPTIAWVRALAEAVERYAACTHTADDFVITTGRELAGDALDLDVVPRCSAREYADPRCPLEPASKDVPIRWALGYSLRDRAERYVPATMSHMYLRRRRGERFWLQITTGVAAHTDLETAVVSAICEVIERDAIALTWLARLPLPQIELDSVSHPTLALFLERLERSRIRQFFFDATTDCRVPTVYTLQLLDGDERLSQFVNCATDLNLEAALAKTIRECAPSRSALRVVGDIPADPRDFTALEHGAIYMGAGERRAAFSFLLDSARTVELSKVSDAPTSRPLSVVLASLRRLGTDVIVLDMTPGEVREAGLWVIRVVIPGLMPMSPIYRARFLGHARLYDYPERAGFGRLTEENVNPEPQPFA